MILHNLKVAYNIKNMFFTAYILSLKDSSKTEYKKQSSFVNLLLNKDLNVPPITVCHVLFSHLPTDYEIRLP